MTETLPPDVVARINDIIIGGPFGDHVGMTLDDIALDRVVVRLTGAPHILNALGIVHGGATATLIDTAATAAAVPGHLGSSIPRPSWKDGSEQHPRKPRNGRLARLR